jgi:hypothetical protein
MRGHLREVLGSYRRDFDTRDETLRCRCMQASLQPSDGCLHSPGAAAHPGSYSRCIPQGGRVARKRNRWRFERNPERLLYVRNVTREALSAQGAAPVRIEGR